MSNMTPARYEASVALLLALYVLVWMNALAPVVESTVRWINYLVFFAAQGIPFLIIYLSYDRADALRRPGLLIGSLLQLLAVIGFLSGIAAWFLRAEIQDRPVLSSVGTLIVEQNPGGTALDSPSVRIYQRCSVLPGLALLRDVAFDDRATDAIIEWQTPSTGRILMKEYAEHPTDDAATTFRLRRFCWGPDL